MVTPSTRSFAACSGPIWRVLFVLLLLLSPVVGWGQAVIPASGSYSNDFDNIGATGTSYPTGWIGVNIASGNAVISPIGITTGSANSGNIYNTGSNNASDRALGSLASGTTVPRFGVQLQNGTGASITSLSITGIMEQWRTGGNLTVETLPFEYSTDATSLITGTWTTLTSLDLVEKLTSLNTNVAVDGNLATNRTAIAGVINSLNVANGATIWIRWTDGNDQGSDGLYAIDNFSLTATTAASTPTITLSSTAALTFTTTEGTASTAQSYTVAGTNLTDDISIVAPTGYQLALETTAGSNTPGTFAEAPAGTPLVPARTGATVAATRVFVRLASTTTVAGSPYNGNLTHSSSGATDVTKAVSGTVTAAPTPGIDAGTGTLSFTTTQGTPSAQQSIGVTATALSAPIQVTAPTGYELSITSGSFAGATNTVQLPATGGNVFVRLSGATTGTYNGTIDFVSGATSASRTVQGTVTAAPTPAIVASPTSLSNFSTTTGTASASQSYTLTPTALSAGITVTAPSGYEVSLSAGTGYAASVTASQTAATTIYVRIAASTPTTATLNGTITNVSGSVSQDVTVSGTVTAAPAAPLLAYNFTNGDTPSTQDPNVTGSAFTRVGVGSNAGTGRFNSNGWPSTINPNEYIQFTFSPNAGYEATLTGLTFVDQRSASGANPYEVRSSLDGYTTPIASGNTSGGDKNITLSGFTAIQPTGVSFRFYYAGSGTYSVDDVQLFGTVTAGTPLPEIDVTQNGTSIPSGTGAASTFTYASTNAGSTTDATFTVTNLGTADLTLGALTLGGTNAGEFSITQQPGQSTLAAAGTTTFVVRFQPTSAGAKTATLSLVNNDGNENPYQIVLTGTGVVVTPTLTATPTSLTINATVGQTAAQSFTLTGSNLPASATVSISSDNTAVEVSTDGGATYGATASAATTATGTLNQTVQVRFTAPAAVGSTTATISSTIGALSATVAVTGNATATPVAGAPGLLLLEENFNYATGSTIAGQGSWTDLSGADPVTVNATGLAYGEYASSNKGLAARIFSDGGSGQDINRTFSIPATATDTYVSFVVNVNSLPETYDEYALALNTSVNYRGRIHFLGTSNANEYQVGLSYRGITIPTSTQRFVKGTSYLFVLRYTVVAGDNNDEIRLYTFNGTTPVIEPATALLQVVNSGTGTNTDVAPTSFTLRTDSDSGTITSTANPVEIVVDGLRVGTGWGAAASRPVYAESTAVINAGNYYSLEVAPGNTRLDVAGPVAVEGSLNLNGGQIFTTAANTLTLTPAATVTGGSNTSFVNGPVARQAAGAGSLLFPVGKGTAYRPLTVNVASQAPGTVTYTAEQKEGTNPQTFDNAASALAPLTRVSNIRRYTVTSSDNTGFNGNIQLSFGADDDVTNPTSPSLVIGKNNGNGWFNIGRITSDASTVTSGNFTSFSDFALASTDPDVTNNPLPVELIRFTAQRQADAVRLDWATASEQNNARFEVQRSADGAQFRTLNTVAGQGTTAQRHAYSALDRQPLSGTAYYRLRQVDTNGQASFSPVVAVAAGKELALYPNPAHTELQVVAPAPEATYRVLSTIGAVLLEGRTSTGNATLNVASLPAGLYHLEVTTAASRVVRKFTKQE
jgi:hypothetical protein